MRRAGPSVDYDLAIRFVGRWLTDPSYATRRGPRPLPRQGGGSFAELAGRIGAEPEALLAGLLAVGAVGIERTGRVVLRDRGYVPAEGVAEKFDILGRDAAEFVETILHNLSAKPGQTRLQRKATYDNIGSRAVPSLRTRLRSLALRALAAANDELAHLDRDRRPAAPGGRRTRVSFGIYIAEGDLAGVSKRSARTARKTRGAKGSHR